MYSSFAPFGRQTHHTRGVTIKCKKMTEIDYNLVDVFTSLKYGGNQLAVFVDFENKVTNKQNAEDLVHDTYLKANLKLGTFKGNSSLKTWGFSIATNLSKNHLSGRNIWSEATRQIGGDLHLRSEELLCKMKEVFYSQPNHKFEIKEHINYCFNCINKTFYYLIIVFTKKS